MKTHGFFLRALWLALAASLFAASPVSAESANVSFKLVTGDSLAYQHITGDSTKSLMPDAQASPQATQEKFDGAKLYKEVFQHFRDRHISLSDPARRAAWVRQWENKHAGDSQLDTEEGTDKAIFEMIRSLGQRFDYYNPPEANQADMEKLDATLVGIGAQLKLKGMGEALYKARKLGENADPKEFKKIFDEVGKVSDTNSIIVEEPIEGGPAEKAGLVKGDRIIRVDGADVNGKTLDEVVKAIRGQEGSLVKITVLKEDENGGTVEKVLDIKRATVVARVVKYTSLGNGIACVKLDNFSSQFTEKEMSIALAKAAKGKAIIIDLRGNPGGRLDAVASIGQYLLSDGVLIASQERRGDEMVEIRTVLTPDFGLATMKTGSGRGQSRTFDREPAIVPAGMPIVVLVDQGSASASEILAGLLQANHRAIVVGKTTVGKGVGQQLIPLSFDRNIHVTTFKFLPGGVAMDWVGVVPDIEVTNPDEVLIDPSRDEQLASAKKAAAEAISKAESEAARRKEIRQDNEDEFKKALDAMEKAKGGTQAP